MSDTELQVGGYIYASATATAILVHWELLGFPKRL